MTPYPNSLRCGRAAYPLLGLVACAAAVVTYLLLPVAAPSAEPVAHAAPSTPSAQEFAHNFVGTTNAYAVASGDEMRVGNAHCVQADRGNYMCSYSAKRPGVAAECHIMQARWTPHEASTITITLAGRAGRCGSLDEALRSLA